MDSRYFFLTAVMRLRGRDGGLRGAGETWVVRHSVIHCKDGMPDFEERRGTIVLVFVVRIDEPPPLRKESSRALLGSSNALKNLSAAL